MTPPPPPMPHIYISSLHHRHCLNFAVQNAVKKSLSFFSPENISAAETLSLNSHTFFQQIISVITLWLWSSVVNDYKKFSEQSRFYSQEMYSSWMDPQIVLNSAVKR
jgi:hypothetical protein